MDASADPIYCNFLAECKNLQSVASNALSRSSDDIIVFWLKSHIAYSVL